MGVNIRFASQLKEVNFLYIKNIAKDKEILVENHFKTLIKAYL